MKMIIDFIQKNWKNKEVSFKNINLSVFNNLFEIVTNMKKGIAKSNLN